MLLGALGGDSKKCEGLVKGASMPKHVLNDQTRVIAQLVGKEDINDLIDGQRVKLDEHGNVLEVDLSSLGLTVRFQRR